MARLLGRLIACLVAAWPGPLMALTLALVPLFSGAPGGRGESHAAASDAGADWLLRARQELGDREYRATVNDQGLQAPNRAHNLRTYFDGTGIRVVDRTAGGNPTLLELHLAGVGRGESITALEAGRVASDGARVESRRRGLVEWFENSAAGLEHGFALDAAPTGDGPLILVLSVGQAMAALEGDQVILSTHMGRRLTYGKPEAFDATGASLAARLEVREAGKLRIVVEDAGATYPVTIDPLLTASADAVLESDQNQAELGYCVAGAGDVNGDGYADVIVGARYYDLGQADEGAAFVFMGGPSGIASGGPATAAATLQSDQEYAHMGISVAGAGDVNADGYADVIVGAHLYDLGEASEGAAFVFLGGPGGVSNGNPTTAAATLEGDQIDAELGWNVAGVGDVNGDRYADVMVSSYLYDRGEPYEGAAFVFLGSKNGIASGSPATANGILEGNQFGAYMGYSIAGAGDVNGDGYADAIVGARFYDDGETDEGAAFVFLGGAQGIASGDPTTAAATLESNQDYAEFGSVLSGAGDVNADGYADVIVGSYAYDAGLPHEGAAFVFLGSATGIASGDPTTAATTLESNQLGAQLGASVSGAGDVNGDGYADVIVGANLFDGDLADEGAAFVFLGGATGIASGDPTTAAATLESNQSGSYMGFTVAGAGDVNGDGYADVIVGAHGYDTPPDESPGKGGAFVFLGGAGGIVSGNPATAAATLESNQGGANLGISVAGAGDVNGDGYGDVIIGATSFDAGETDEGAAFVFLGGPGGVTSGSPASAATVLESNQAGALLGRSLAGAGDVNGDGYADVIVGANSYDAGEADEGAAFVFLGSASGIASGNPATAAATLQANQLEARLGTSVAGAGDVNGDGFADVIVGANLYDAGETDEGAAFVFHGSAGGIASGNPATATTTLQSNQSGANLGISVAGAGDVNGNGFADVIVGAYLYDAGETDEGAAFVFLGSASGIASGNPTTAAATLQSNQSNAVLGASVAGAGDVNGDGYTDVIAGAPGYAAGEPGEGAAFVFLGGPGGIASGNPATADATLESNQEGANLGSSTQGAGDVNGDGHADVVVGAPSFDATPSNQGAAFVFLGGPGGIASGDPGTAAATLESNQGDANLGSAVAGAGDVNGDGFADVIVGAQTYDGGESDEGAAFLFLGGGNAGRSLAGGGSRGRRVLARQGRGDGSGLPVQAWGGSHIIGGFQRFITATDPLGRERVKIETESCPPGVRFGNVRCVRAVTPTWVDVTATPAGVTFTDNVVGLAPNTVQRWRARVLYAAHGVTQPGIQSPPRPSHGPWRRLSGQAVEADVRIGGGLLAVASRPASAELAIERLFPNPTQGDISVSFALTTFDRTKLELFDIAGRRLIGRDLGRLGPGSHTVRLVDGKRLVPGLYLARLSQGREVADAKVLVMD